MSGGHFDYNQSFISDIANEIQELLDRQGKLIPEYECNYGGPFEYETFSPIVQEKFAIAIRVLREAATYTQRIDYFLCGDDGEDNFIRRLSEDLSDL